MELNKLIQIKDHLDDIYTLMNSYDSKHIYRTNSFIIYELVYANIKTCKKLISQIDKISNDGTQDKVKWKLLASVQLYLRNSYQVIEFIDYIILNKEPTLLKRLALSDHIDQAKIILESETSKLLHSDDDYED